MPTTTLLSRIEARYSELRQAGHPGTSYPDDFKVMVASYAHLRRTEGDKWALISDRIPVSSTTAQKWVRQHRPGSMVPVLVGPTPSMATPFPAPAAPELTLTTPNGFRLSGIDLDQATQLLGRLG